MTSLDPKNNKFLTFADGVVRTQVTDKVIARLEPFFKKHDHHAVVTSVKRTAEDQLRLINQFALNNNLHYNYPIHYGKPDVKIKDTTGQEIYAWQYVWSSLLNIGVLINPPLRAEVLLDYWRRGVNKKGRMINPSAHFSGKVFDIGGASNGITDEVEVISEAMSEDRNLGIARFILERKNNAVHIICS